MSLSGVLPFVQLHTSAGPSLHQVAQLSAPTQAVAVCAAILWLVAVGQGAVYSARRLLTLAARLRTGRTEQLRRARDSGLPDEHLAALGQALAAEQRQRYRAERNGWLWIAAGQFVMTIVLFAFWYYILGVRDTSGACQLGQPSWTGQGPCDGHFWWSALHLSVGTITTLGAGDVQPYGPARILADVEVLAGVVYVGVFIAGLTKVLETSDFEED